jgi:predicted dehydrogenase
MALYGTLRFPDDVVAQFEASFLAPERQLLEVVGEGGVLRVHAPWRVDWGGDLVLERDGASEVLEVEQANSYTLELENLADAVEGRAPALLGRDDAVAQARVIEALYRAAEERSAVVL